MRNAGVDDRGVIACYTLSNCGGLAIYDVDDFSREILVGYNTDDPDWLPLTTDDDGRECFEWGGRVIPLDECVRVGGDLCV